MKKDAILPKLPLELGAFTELQRKNKLRELGSGLDEADKELCEAVVLTANLVYYSILDNDFRAVEDIIGDMEDTFGFDIKNPATYTAHTTVILCWVQIAAKQALSELATDPLNGPFVS